MADADALRLHLEDLAVRYRAGTRLAASDLDGAMEAARALHHRVARLRQAPPGTVDIQRTLAARDAVAAATVAVEHLGTSLREP